MKLLFFGIVIGTVLLGSCSSVQTIDIAEDGSGNAVVTIMLSSVMSAYLNDLSAVTGEEQDTFDPAAIEEAITQEIGLSFVSAQVLDADTVTVHLTFDIRELLSHRKGFSPFLRFERTEDFRRLLVYVDKSMVEKILDVFGVEKSVQDALLPSDDMNSAEYHEHLVWALEEYEQDIPISLVVSRSQSETRITPHGKIIQLYGGERTADGMSFLSPLITAVTERTQYSFIFAPIVSD